MTKPLGITHNVTFRHRPLRLVLAAGAAWAIAGCSGGPRDASDERTQLEHLEHRLATLETRVDRLSNNADQLARQQRREAGSPLRMRDFPEHRVREVRTLAAAGLTGVNAKAEKLPIWGSGLSETPSADEIVASTTTNGVTLAIARITRWDGHAVYDLVLSSPNRARVSFPTQVTTSGASGDTYQVSVSVGPNPSDSDLSPSPSSVQLEPHQRRRAIVVQLNAGEEESVRDLTFWGEVDGEIVDWAFASPPIDD